MSESFRPVVTGVIGAGAISDAYLSNLTGQFSDAVRVKRISANHIENAQKKAERYGLTACTNEEIFNDPEIEMVIILTPVGSHYELIRSALQAGKHVYTEKTVTVYSGEAESLIALAEEKDLYLGSAPDTFLGSCFETVKKAVQDGMCGDIHSFSVSITRNNDLLTSMFPFLRQPGAGILRDYVVYYLTALCAMLGEVDSVAACLQAPYQTRTCILPQSPEFKTEISTPNESIVTAVLRMKNGVIGTLHDDSETYALDRADFVICGRGGMIIAGDPNHFGDPVRFLPAIPKDFTAPEAPQVLEPVNPYSGQCRGLGAKDMAYAIRTNGKHRASARLALHVLKVIEAIERSSISGKFEKVG